MSIFLSLFFLFQVSAQDQAYLGAADPNPVKVLTEKPVQDYSYKYLPPSGREGGEDISSAVVISSLPYNDTGNTCDNIDDYDEACLYSGSTSPDVVYSYSPAVDEFITIDLCNSLYDTKVYVYENTAGNLIACNDDGPCGYSGYQSRLDMVYLTAGNTYYIVVDGYGGDCGEYVLNVSEYEIPWCMDYCAPGSTPEGEPDIPDEGEDVTNGGCNNTVPIFSPIALNQVICGRCNTYVVGTVNTRDTDWYEITLSEGGTLYFTGIANFTMQLILIYNTDCNNPQYVLTTTFGNCDEGQVSYTVGPGTYWFWVGPTFFDGMPDGQTYNIIATLDAPPPPDWAVAVVPVSNWALFIAIGLIAAFVVFRIWRRS
jgi:hypothetical protein